MRSADSFDYVSVPLYCYRQRRDSLSRVVEVRDCDDLKDVIIACMESFRRENEDLRQYYYRYMAYRLATFVALQAFPPEWPKESVKALADYQWVLAYHAGNKKVKYIHELSRLLGFRNTCRLIRLTRVLWDSRRNKIGA